MNEIVEENTSTPTARHPEASRGFSSSGQRSRLPPRELLERYDGPGPRYTSYPTAPQFHTDFGSRTLQEHLKSRNLEDPCAPLSLYVHIPFCSSPCFFCGCTKVITRQREPAEIYLDHLGREIKRFGAMSPSTRIVEQLHFGGGTPTYLDLQQLAAIMDDLERNFTLSNGAEREFSIEIDPRTVSPEHLYDLHRLGFNRISLGVQDFEPAVQKAVNRIQPVEQTLSLIDAARRAGFRSVSVDLIYGLPLQTLSSFARTLDLVVSAKPDRIAAYSYAHLPQRFKPQRQIHQADLPNRADKLNLLQQTVARLIEAGYRYIGMDHFALPEDALSQAADVGALQRNFQGYSTHGDADLIGLGMSAISRIGSAYSQNRRTLNSYAAAISAGNLAVERGLILSDEDRLRGEIIMSLMCRGELDSTSIADRYKINFSNYFAQELEHLRKLADDDLVTLHPDRIQVTEMGRHFLRVIAMVFDVYLNADKRSTNGNLPQYSRVI